ncbi:MAG TPA: hypothetical protein VEB59_13445 [Gemmatimonadales bacterium]|nr:hypothetical protein [Gemmatimonadales bacterium]
MLLPLVFQLLNSVGNVSDAWCLAASLLVRVRPEHAHIYPWVPGGVWLPAHRRAGDRGTVWLDSNPSSGKDLPLSVAHVEIRGPDVPPD